jgi:hypothetical protein
VVVNGEAIATSPNGGREVPWHALLAGPVAWAFNQGVGYAVMKPVCAHHATPVLWLISAAAFALAAAGVWIGWRRVRGVRSGADEEGRSAIDRTFFVAVLAVAMNGLLSLLIVTAAIPQFLLNPCE